MKNKILNLLVFSFFLLNLNAQEVKFDFWTLGTAKVIPKAHKEIGVFSPFRYGLTDKLEFLTSLQTFLLVPNLALKKEWGSFKNDQILVSSKHAIYYPVPSLFINQKTGYGGDFIPVDYKIPIFLLGFVNELLFSKLLVPKTSCDPPNYLLTLKLGLQLGFGSLDTAITIDKKLLYHRSEVFHGKPLWYVGADLQAHWNETWDYNIDACFYSSNWGIEKWAIEHKLLLIYPMSENLKFMFGYKFSVGSYPDQTRFLMLPLLDFVWHFSPSKKVERGLFDEKMF